MELNLLEKTELFITNLELDNVNLSGAASVVARVLGLKENEVAVVDVREGMLTLDILRPTVQLENIIGKEKDLLAALQALPGVYIGEETKIHSEGVLGMLCLDAAQTDEVVEESERLGSQIRLAVSKRVRVHPTGSEIIKGYIEDTNTPFLIEQLKRAGYKAVAGPVLEDDLSVVVTALEKAVSDGFGLVITTGGVGAEDKDHMVEAVQRLDRRAATPYIVRYQQGQGRHRKDGVRIAVGCTEWTTFVALPGPHDEVRMALPLLIEGLGEKWDNGTLANALVSVLRKKWTAVSHGCRHH